MDTIDVQPPLAPALIPIGTIRHGVSMRLSREDAEPGQWRIAVDAIKAETRFGAVVITPGWPPAPIWEPEAAHRGIVFGSRVEIGIVEACEEFVAAVLTGVPLDARHGLRLDPQCPYPIPMREQVGVAWVA